MIDLCSDAFMTSQYDYDDHENLHCKNLSISDQSIFWLDLWWQQWKEWTRHFQPHRAAARDMLFMSMRGIRVYEWFMPPTTQAWASRVSARCGHSRPDKYSSTSSSCVSLCNWGEDTHLIRHTTQILKPQWHAITNEPAMKVFVQLQSDVPGARSTAQRLKCPYPRGVEIHVNMAMKKWARSPPSLRLAVSTRASVWGGKEGRNGLSRHSCPRMSRMMMLLQPTALLFGSWT